jgi:hypothetical protein
MTFIVLNTVPTTIQHEWLRRYEAFSFCKHCLRTTTFVLAQTEHKDKNFLSKNEPTDFSDALNNHFKVEGFINIKDLNRRAAPEFTEKAVAAAFDEATASMTVQAWNAAGTMFRLAIDLATRPLLPTIFTPGLNRRTRRDLAPRLAWLFDNGQLPRELQDLSTAIREDGNDGAHAGTLEKEDVEDLLDFAVALFERMYTEPERLKRAKARRDQRRGNS